MVFKNKDDKPTAVMSDLKGYITFEEYKLMLDHAPRGRDWLLIFLLWKTGRRITEIVGRKAYKTKAGKEYPAIIGLRPCDIQWTKGLIEFRIEKKRRASRVLWGADNETMSILKLCKDEWGLLDPEQFINFDRTNAYRRIRKISASAGIHQIGDKPPHPHAFRHGFAIDFLKSNEDNPAAIRVLQQQLCHSSLDTTSIYLQFSQKDAIKMLEKRQR